MQLNKGNTEQSCLVKKQCHLSMNISYSAVKGIESSDNYKYYKKAKTIMKSEISADMTSV